jgi:hypothetical protein
MLSPRRLAIFPRLTSEFWNSERAVTRFNPSRFAFVESVANVVQKCYQGIQQIHRNFQLADRALQHFTRSVKSC